MKKVLLALCLLMGYATLHAYTTTGTVNGITWTYQVSSGEVQIHKSEYTSAIPSSTSGAITIPSTLSGYPVTTIGDGAFRGCSSLTSVIIPEDVTSIGDYAFYGCSSLTSVTIPEGVTSIGEYAFNGCTTLPRDENGVQYESDAKVVLINVPTSLTGEFVIPNSVRIIYSSAFENCSNLTSVTIPEGITGIEDRTFYGCSGLTSVIIPESVMWIGESAFYGCAGLTSIEIPMYAILESGAFMNCAGLTSISHTGGAWLCGFNIFANCTGLKTAHLNSIWEYSDGLFSGCTNLEVVTIGYIEGAIPNSAFYGCTNLTTVDLSQSDGYCSRIGVSAFYNCSSLTTINLPEDLYGYSGYGEIQSDAFNGCKSLKLIKIPDGVSMIHPGAFAGCIGLEEVSIPNSVFEDNYGYGSGIFEDSFKDVAPRTLIAKQFPVNSGMSAKNLTTLVIPDGTTEIIEAAFMNCTTLQSVTIPASVNQIGKNAFSGCEQLKSLTVPSRSVTIGAGAFQGCLTLSDVNIQGDSTLGDGVFSDCPSLKRINFNGTIPTNITNLPPNTEYYYSLENAKAWKEKLDALNSPTYPVSAVVEATSMADVIVSAEMTTPKTMSVTYTIHSEVKSAAKVYALAFEEGKRSFAKVVLVKTATEDSPSPIPNGTEVATNTPHTFIWNVPADWDTDLSKVMVEILVQEVELFPLELITIPGDATTSDMTITRNALRQSELFNALLWCYASGDSALTNDNGILKANGTQIANGESLSSSGAQATALLNYLYGKMGYKVLAGADLSYAEEMTELDFSSSGLTQVAIKIATASASEE